MPAKEWEERSGSDTGPPGPQDLLTPGRASVREGFPSVTGLGEDPSAVRRWLNYGLCR